MVEMIIVAMGETIVICSYRLIAHNFILYSQLIFKLMRMMDIISGVYCTSMVLAIYRVCDSLVIELY